MQERIWVILVGLVMFFVNPPPVASGEVKRVPPNGIKKDQARNVASGLTAIANQLSLRPESTIDFSEVSGEYCFDVDISEGGHMTHYAIDPTKTQEDIIDFVNAESLIKAGIEVDKLPRLPKDLGQMTPNQWYYLPAGEMDPHHGMKFPFPLMIRASNLE